MNVISVVCKSDERLHLAPKNERGVLILTLCLERWQHREPAREDSTFCPVCLEKYKYAWGIDDNHTH